MLGSRYVPGGSGGRLAAAPAAALPRRATATPAGRCGCRSATPPAATGPRAGELIDALPFDDVASQGYCFQVDWAWRAVRAGARVVEVPITFTERAFGRSKMSGSIVGEALVRVTVWGLRDRLADWLPGRVAPSRTGTTPATAGGRARPGRRAAAAGPRRATEDGRRTPWDAGCAWPLALLVLAELVVFVLVASWIGVGWTILADAGHQRARAVALLARQGTRALAELRERARTRQPGRAGSSATPGWSRPAGC